jgi:hypothetical protein
VSNKFLIIFLLFAYRASAQNNETPFALWAFPGLSWQKPDHLKIYAQAGFNPQQHMNAVYLQAFLRTGKHLTLNPAYLYLNRQSAGAAGFREHGLMNAAILHFNWQHFTVEDRNLLWNRFRKDAEDLHFYRNRFRVYGPVTKGKFRIRPYLFDEAFYFLTRGKWSRNRMAAGFVLDMGSSMNIDAFLARENDHYNGRMALLFIMATFRLPSVNGNIK